MYKITLLLGLVAATYGGISPYSLQDKAIEKLNELQITLTSAIQAAETQLTSAQTSYTDYKDKVENQAEVQITDESNRIEGLIDDMKTLAQSAQVNIDNCLLLYPQDLVNITINNLKTCIYTVTVKVVTEVSNTKKAVEDTNNTFNELSTELSNCVGDNIKCISPVLRDIQQDAIQLPENIDKNVHTAVDLIDTLTPQVDQCSSTSVTNYMTRADDAQNSVNTCVSNLV